MPCTPRNRFSTAQGAGRRLPADGQGQPSGPCIAKIQGQFEGKRQILFLAKDHELGHGRDITWTLQAKEATNHLCVEWLGTSWNVEVVTTGQRDGKPFNACDLFLTSIRTTPEPLLQLVRDRWSIEGWHWIRDTQLNEDAHRYRGNGAGGMGCLRTVALDLLRLGGICINPLGNAEGVPRHHGDGGDGTTKA